MRVKALKYYYHDKQEHHPGEEFEMDDRMESEVNILCCIGTLEKVVGAPQPAIQTRVMEAEPEQKEEPEETTEEPEADGTKRKRFYRRRDLTAEK